MDWFVSNWFLVVAAIAVIATVVWFVVYFFKLPTAKQIENLKEWLKFAVTEAERELGSGTGQLKLRMVYDMAIAKFPWVAKVVTFDSFSKWVDESLEWMRKQLSENESVKNLVESNGDAKSLS